MIEAIKSKDKTAGFLQEKKLAKTNGFVYISVGRDYSVAKSATTPVGKTLASMPFEATPSTMNKTIILLAVISIFLQSTRMLLAFQGIEAFWLTTVICLYLVVAAPYCLFLIVKERKRNIKTIMANFLGFSFVCPIIIVISIALQTFFNFQSVDEIQDIRNSPEEQNLTATDFESYKTAEAEFKFFFPRKVYLNESYNGRIWYKGILDTITTSFDDDKNARYIYLSMGSSPLSNIDERSIRRIANDTFGALNHRTIQFDSISFNKLGRHYFHGVIKDHILIDTVQNPTKKDYLVRLIEKEYMFKYEVEVIQRENIKM